MINQPKKINERVYQMNKKLVAYFLTGAISLAAIGGVSTLSVANAATNNNAVVQSTVKNNNDTTGYNSSIKLTSQSNSQDEFKSSKENEANESAKLKSLAKISETQAKDAALKVVPGTVSKVELDNENGNVVYSVNINTNSGTVDVKVDAGNGKVLKQDKENDNENNAKANETEKPNVNEKDNDNLQVQQQGENQN